MAALLGCLLGCAHPGAPTGDEQAYQQALDKAKEWRETQAFVLAEAEARKALALRPDDQQANFVLFEVLADQSEDEAKLAEARRAAEGIKSSFPSDSQQHQAAAAFLDKLEARALLAQLEQAIQEKSPQASELLDQIPEGARDPHYWGLAYRVLHDKHPKQAAEAAAKWLEADPHGLDASAAEKLVELDRLGLLDGPVRAFESMRTQSDWEKFLLQPTARHDYFQQLLKVAKVVEVKAKDKTATVTLEFTDPFQKKKVTQPAVLAYEVRGGAYLLDLEATDLSRVLVALADGEHPIRADFDGIAGVFSAARPTIVGIRRSLGRGELRKDDLKLKPQPNIDMDHIELSRALLFGDLAVGYLDLKDDYGIITSLDIVGPGFRTRDGLGVGSALADFGAYQTVDIRAFGKYNLMRDMHPPLLPDGKLDQYRIVGALHPSQKSGLALFLDAQDRVQAIGFKVGSTQAEKL